jgi:ATP-dependent exoDNAse (exonuclease V) beta subunit
MKGGFMQIKKLAFSSILGWSVSRYRTFNDCQRQYYYQYYGKFDIASSKLEFLKKLTSIPLEVGNIVHDLNKELLKRLIKSAEPINLEKFYTFARQITESYCKNKIFHERYYQGIQNIDTEKIFAKIKTSLSNILDSERFKWIAEKAIANSNDWIIEPPGFGEARIDGMKVYCKVDFLFPMNDEIYILDWKTGKHDGEKHHTQLMGYTIWASYHFNKPPEQITPIIAYLQPTYHGVELKFTNTDIHSFAAQIKKESEEMYLKCADIDKNIPTTKM